MSADYRQTVLARIKEALRQPAPHRHGPVRDPLPVANGAAKAPDDIQTWLPIVGKTPEAQLELFRQNSAGLQTDFQQVRDRYEAADYLKTLAKKHAWQRLATHRFALVENIAFDIGLPVMFTNADYSVTDLETCDAAITGCDALVAQTGSVLVSSESAGGRALSVLPPHHIVIATRGQMVPDLSVALAQFRQRYAARWPSFFSFITGPSRTGDIERILVLGAHGPKHLTVLLLDK